MFCHVLLLAAVALQLLGPWFPFPRAQEVCVMENTLPSVVADSQVVVALSVVCCKCVSEPSPAMFAALIPAYLH
jgi:hypothetical protein